MWKIPQTVSDPNTVLFITNILICMNDDMLNSIKACGFPQFDDNHKNFHILDILKTIWLPTSADGLNFGKIVAWMIGCEKGIDVNILGLFMFQATQMFI